MRPPAAAAMGLRRTRRHLKHKSDQHLAHRLNA